MTDETKEHLNALTLEVRAVNQRIDEVVLPMLKEQRKWTHGETGSNGANKKINDTEIKLEKVCDDMRGHKQYHVKFWLVATPILSGIVYKIFAR